MIIEILILISGFPVGLWIAWLASDELVVGRVWFRVLVILGLLGTVGFWLYGFPSGALSSSYVAIVSLASLIKSRDKNWTGRMV
jgi:hypothetical protein